MIKRGVPSVVLVHTHFERLAHAALRQLGVKTDPAQIVIAYPTDRPSAETPDELRDKAQDVVGRLAAMIAAQGGP
jgi:hypothetical protein